jgi:hypothetical protein
LIWNPKKFATNSKISSKVTRSCVGTARKDYHSMKANPIYVPIHTHHSPMWGNFLEEACSESHPPMSTTPEIFGRNCVTEMN